MKRKRVRFLKVITATTWLEVKVKVKAKWVFSREIGMAKRKKLG